MSVLITIVLYYEIKKYQTIILRYVCCFWHLLGQWPNIQSSEPNSVIEYLSISFRIHVITHIFRFLRRFRGTCYLLKNQTGRRRCRLIYSHLFCFRQLQDGSVLGTLHKGSCLISLLFSKTLKHLTGYHLSNCNIILR